jgi:hypothetical protein
VATEPAPASKAFEPAPQLVLIAAEVDVSPPAAEARLDDIRSRKCWSRHVANMCRPRLLDTGSTQ